MSVVRFSVAVGLVAVCLYFLKIYFGGGVCRDETRLDGKTVVITGGNTGIGKETAIDLAKRGAKVIIGCRNKEKSQAALADIKRESGSDLVYLKMLDLASFSSIKAFADEIIRSETRLDILINNAGIMMCPFTKTKEGFESQFGVNHLGHFLLTNLLLDLIKKSSPSRIINVSSKAHSYVPSINFETLHDEESYSRITSYGISKLANVLFTRELHKRLTGTGVSTFSLHPGVVNTELTRHVIGDIGELFVIPIRKIFLKDSKEGAQTTICCAVSDNVLQHSGEYFADCVRTESSAAGKNMTLAKNLWGYSVRVTKIE